MFRKILTGAVAACLLLAMPAAASENLIEAKGKTFSDLTVAENKSFAMRVSDTDTDLSDGYTWQLSFDNKGSQAFVVSVTNAAINGIMCSTDEWSVNGWTLPPGETTAGSISWDARALEAIGADDVHSVAFTLKVYKYGSYAGIEGVCIDEQITIVLDEAGDGAESLSAEDETETGEASGADAETAEDSGADADGGEDALATLLDNDAYTICLLSVRTDEEGTPHWDVLIENHTEKTEMFEIQDAVVNGWAIDPYWYQVLLPETKAYSDISWWTLDADMEEIADIDEAQFNIKAWKVQNGWTPGYTAEETFPALVSDIKADRVPLAEEEDFMFDDADFAVEEDTEEDPESVSMVLVDETETEQVLYAVPAAPAAEAQTEVPEGEGGQAETSVETDLTLYDEEGMALGIIGIETRPAEDYIQLTLHLENGSDREAVFSADTVLTGEERIPVVWTQRLPANSRKNSSFYADLSRNAGKDMPDEMTVSFSVTRKDVPAVSVVSVIDLEKKELKENTISIEEETEEPAETESEEPAEAESEEPAEAESEEPAGAETETGTADAGEKTEAETESGAAGEAGTEAETVKETEAAEAAETETGTEDGTEAAAAPEEETEEAVAAEEETEEADEYTDTDTIRNLQAALTGAGYDCGTADGEIGDVTRGQIEKYRADKKLTAGDRVDDELLFSLGIADAKTMKAVQEALNKEGFDCGTPDGLTGDQSRQAIADYRAKNGLGEGEGVDEALLKKLGIRKEEE